MERTLILIKPDAIQRSLTGTILDRFERKGLKIVGLKMIHLSDAILKRHYAHLADKPFFPGIVNFMKSSPVIALCLEGKDAVNVVRKLCGVTNGRDAEPGTIRGDYSSSVQCNTVHASDSYETAVKEIERFFEKHELFEYSLDNIKFILSPDEQE